MSDSQPEKFFFTVGQMTEALRAFPADLPVKVSGYESGYEDFYHSTGIKLKREPENPYCAREFQKAGYGKKDAFGAVALKGDYRPSS